MKWIALIMGTLYQIAHFLPEISPLWLSAAGRVFGPISFALFAYQSVVSCRKTRSVAAYFFRLAAVAAVTQLILGRVMAITGYEMSPNVLITYCLGIMMSLGLDMCVAGLKKEEVDRPIKVHDLTMSRKQSLYMGASLMVMSGALTFAIKPTYSYYGVLTYLVLYVIDQYECRELASGGPQPEKPIIWFLVSMTSVNLLWTAYNLYANLLIPEDAIVYLYSVAAVPTFSLISKDKVGGAAKKWFFYLYYPLHFLAFLLI